VKLHEVHQAIEEMEIDLIAHLSLHQKIIYSASLQTVLFFSFLFLFSIFYFLFFFNEVIEFQKIKK